MVSGVTWRHGDMHLKFALLALFADKLDRNTTSVSSTSVGLHGNGMLPVSLSVNILQRHKVQTIKHYKILIYYGLYIMPNAAGCMAVLKCNCRL